MIILRNKTYSERSKVGWKGAGIGALTGLVSSPMVGIAFGGLEGGLRNVLATSIASAMLLVPMGVVMGYKSSVTKYDLDNKKKELENQKLEIKKRQELGEIERMEEEERKIELVKSQLLKEFPEIDGLCKIYQDKELKSLEPKWGDGDEYPCFNLEFDHRKKNLVNGFLPIIITSYQDQRIGINCHKIYWCTENKPNQKINNLKNHLLNYYQKDLSEWKNINYLDDNDRDEVIKWLECIIRKIKQYL